MIELIRLNELLVLQPHRKGFKTFMYLNGESKFLIKEGYEWKQLSKLVESNAVLLKAQ